MTKLTKRDHFNALLAIPAVAQNETLVNFIENELEILDRKKASASAKPTKAHEENLKIKERLVEVLDQGQMMTITMIQQNDVELAKYSNQKLNALITQLKSEGRVEKIVDKRKAYFKAI